MYGNRVLRFCIHPDQHGWVVKDLPGACSRDFNNTNYARFKQIRVEIHPPDIRGPGQLLSIRKCTTDLVSAFAEAPNLSEIKIVLLENESATWYLNNIPQSCLPNIAEDDIEHAMCQCCLDQAPNCLDEDCPRINNGRCQADRLKGCPCYILRGPIMVQDSHASIPDREAIERNAREIIQEFWGW